MADPSTDRLIESVRRQAARRERARREGEPSFARHLAQVGVLGWTIVIPTLVGAFLGRWLDQRFAAGIFWTGALLVLGLAAGCWAGWRWMRVP